MKQFDKLCETFNIDGLPEETVSDELLGKTEQENDGQDETSNEEEPVIEYKGQKYTLKSFQYMKLMLQEKIAQDQKVLETCGQMCKLNAQARYFEVYATLSNTVANHIKQLQDLEKVETDYQVTQSKEELQKAAMAQRERMAAKRASSQTLIQHNTTNNNLFLSSSELDAMIEKAEEDVRINTKEISTDFDLS